MSTRRLTKTASPGIYRRGSSYVVRARDAGGKQVQRSARTLAEARRVRAELIDGAAKGATIAVDRQITISTLVEHWIENYAGSTSVGVRAETRTEYARDARRAAKHFGSRRRVVEIAPSDVRAFARTLAETGQGTRSVRRVVGVLRLVLEAAVEDGILATNAASGLRLGNVQTRDDQGVHTDEVDPRILSAKQLGALIAATPEGWERLLVRLVGSTGVRISEALGFQWGDLDIAKREIRVRRRVRDGKAGPVKTKRGRRSIPVSAELVRDLTAHRLASRYSGAGDYVFATMNGSARYQTSTYRMLRESVERAGVPWPGGWHGLRRSAASAWLSGGIPLATVADLLGHTPAVTLRAYSFALESDQPNGEKLAGMVGAG